MSAIADIRRSNKIYGVMSAVADGQLISRIISTVVDMCVMYIDF